MFIAILAVGYGDFSPVNGAEQVFGMVRLSWHQP